MGQDAPGALRVFSFLVLGLSIPTLGSVTGCSEEVTGPTPALPSPTAGALLPVDPGLVCRHQISNEITLSGERLSPIPIDIPGNPRAALPDIALIRARELDGATAASGPELVWSGTPGGANADKVSWQSQRQMRFILDQAITQPDGSSGLVARGLYDVRVVNPNTNEATSLSTLAVIDKPTLAPPAPGIVCLAEEARDVALSGASLLRMDGRQSEIAVDGVNDRFALDAFTGCTAIPHAGIEASLCTGANLRLGVDSVVVGYPALTLHNPETGACQSEEAINLRVVPPPTLVAADPPVVCVAEGPREVTLIGEGFLRIDGLLPSVTMDGAALEVLGVDGCEALVNMVHEASTCTRLNVRLPQADNDQPYAPTLVIENPQPAGCSGTKEKVLVIVPPPDIADIEPPTLCDDDSLQTLTLTGSWFFVIDEVVPTVRVDGVASSPERVVPGDCEPLDVPEGITVDACTRIELTVDPSAITDGAATIAMTNPDPAGCSDTYVPDIPLVDPPRVSAVEPALVCDADGERTLLVTGTGFLRVGGTTGALPSVSIGGVTTPVSSVGGCQTTPIGPLSDIETCTSLTVTVPEDSLSPGKPAILVTNPYPAACASSTSGPLTVPPLLAITSASPNGVCINAAAQTVTFSGDGFLRIDGEPPALSLNAIPFDIAAMSGCTDLGVASDETFESCTSFEVLVDQSQLGRPDGGVVVVALTNGEPSGCGLSVSEVFFVTPVPDVTSVAPSAICADLATTITVRGADFSPAADLTITRTGATGGGAPVELAVTYVSATELSVAIPDGLEPGTYDVTVSNAEGCEDTLPASLTLLPRPVVFFVDPPVVPNDLDLQVSVYVANINGGDVQSLQIRPLGATEWVTLEHVFDPLRPTRVLGTIPRELIEDGELTTFEVTVQDGLGCPAALDGSLDLSRDLALAPFAVSPPFGGTQRSSAVTLRIATTAVGDRFVELPRAYLSPTVGEGLATPMASVGFINQGELSALVPAGLEPGDYDVIVVNPDGAVGLSQGGFRVTENPPPRIDTIAPGSVPAAGTTVIVFGEDFDTSTVTLFCRAFDAPNATPVERTATVTLVTAEELRFTVPTGINQNDICLVRVTNVDGSFDTFSALVQLTPAENIPRQLDANQPLMTARRGASSVVSGPTRSARFLYAFGGDTGTLASALTSVETAPLTAFGELGPWRENATPLPTPRTLGAAVAIDRFIYVTGGDTGSGATDSVLRAEVLRPEDAPEVEGELEIVLDPAGLTPGLWYYRVSAQLSAADPDNPGGETLASEPLAVLVPPWAPDGFRVTFRWSAVPNAASYHIYRSPTAGTALAGVIRIATVEASLREYSDELGELPDTVLGPRRLGDLGAWRTVAALGTPRADLGLGVATDPGDREVRYLYATGGRDAAGTELGTYEFLRVELQDDDSQSLGESWTAGAATFPARRAHGLFVADATATTQFSATTTWLYVGPGIGAANASRFYSAQVQAGGTLSSWQQAFSGAVNRAGYGAAAAANQLFLFGGGDGATASNSRDSGNIESGGLLGNINATGNSMLLARTRMGAAIGSGRMFMVGGATASGVTATVESALW